MFYPFFVIFWVCRGRTAATCVVYILQVKNFVYILFSGPEKEVINYRRGGIEISIFMYIE